MVEAVVIGTKRSGLAAAELLVQNGARVRALDMNSPAPDARARFAALGVEVTAQTEESIGSPDLVVVSPAVPYDLPMLNAVRSRGIPVIGEVELASRYLRGPIIGITGSNGKTTTTALTGHLLTECGVPAQVGGNIGTAVAALVESSRAEQWNVLELSSFQLESIEHFRAQIGACLNVTPDHLDRHHTFDLYAGAKGRLFENQRPSDHCVLNYDDPICRRFGDSAKSEVHWFSSSQPVPSGLWLEGEVLRLNGQQWIDRSAIRLRGIHNVENVMASALMAHLAGATFDGIAAAIATFPGVEHRIEFVRALNGVQYFNDSKATNVDAALKAVDAFTGPLWIILGGKDKGGSYAPLVEPLKRKAKAALLIGAEPPYENAAGPKIARAFADSVDVVTCGNVERAVKYARTHAAPGDIVLLAPACASFDQFSSYEERGRHFKQIVKELV